MPKRKRETNIMKINDKYFLESDNLNVILFETKVITGNGRGRKSTKEIGSTYSQPVAYFSITGEPLKDALHYIANHEIFGDGLDDIKQVAKRQQEIYDLINSCNHAPQLSK
jgi:hypothetical protein